MLTGGAFLSFALFFVPAPKRRMQNAKRKAQTIPIYLVFALSIER
jgi:hypothetical protein